MVFFSALVGLVLKTQDSNAEAYCTMLTTLYMFLPALVAIVCFIKVNRIRARFATLPAMSSQTSSDDDEETDQIEVQRRTSLSMHLNGTATALDVDTLKIYFEQIHASIQEDTLIANEMSDACVPWVFVSSPEKDRVCK